MNRGKLIKLIIVVALVLVVYHQFGVQAQANIQLDTFRLTLRGMDPLVVLIIGAAGGYGLRAVLGR